jgi:hypothetical protein
MAPARPGTCAAEAATSVVFERARRGGEGQVVGASGGLMGAG